MPGGSIYRPEGFRKEYIHEAHFRAKEDRNGPIPSHCPDLGPCWNWKGAKNSRGYGCFAILGRSFLAHRVAVVLSGRSIPDGLTVDHLCRNIVCCNPRHLDVVILAENLRRMPAATSRFCNRGHEYTPSNTIAKPNGCRNCRKCLNLRRRINEASRRVYGISRSPIPDFKSEMEVSRFEIGQPLPEPAPITASEGGM